MNPSNDAMKGKTCLITGGSSGLGRAAAAGLAKLGAAVVIVSRDRERGEAARAGIVAETGGGGTVEMLVGDLSSQGSIRALVEEFESKHDRLHALVNCAAVWKSRREVSPDGIEMMFATNHLGYFLLTNLLLDTLKHSAPSVVFNLTAPSTVKLNFNDLQGERRFSAVRAFGATKAANLLFTFALARRLEGSGVGANAYHPGVARSGLMREAPVPMRLFGRVLGLFASPPERATEGLVKLVAANAGGANGAFFHEDKPMEPPPYTRNERVQERLWEVSARLVGLR
jgi:NAD(P)-dependent dehydrogenase (short-subunit alcohol dehydrogenase family)